VQAQGFEVTSDGNAPTPTLSVANLDGTISALCLVYDNMAQAKVIRHFTFAQYLDARNYPEGNPEADPTKEKLDVFY
ncbi:phage minor tail protein L, partial [Desulfocurvus sp. DL9XJH121]